MVPIVITKALTAANAVGISASQTPGAAGNLTLVGGGPVLLGSARRVIITSAGNNVGRTFTIYGTNATGGAIQDTVAGTSGTAAQSNQDFATVTRVAIDGASTGAVTVGTNTTGSTGWMMPNYHLTPFQLDVEGNFTAGTGTWSLEYTLSDYVTPGALPVIKATTVVAAAGAGAVAFTTPIRGWRATILSGTGTLTVEAIQAGIVN